MSFIKPVQVLFFVMIQNWHCLYLFCESEELLGAEQYLHVFLPLMIVEGSEKIYWMSHFECRKKD